MLQSGTGKTMAPHGIAKRLGTQLSRFDHSRVVSKYIGDTDSASALERFFSAAG